MRLLFVTNQLDVGGIETNLVRLTSSLSARGHRCTVAARAGTLSEEVVAAGGTLVELAMSPSRPMSFGSDLVKLRRVLVEERPDVVHVFSATAALATWLPAHSIRNAPPVVASIMGLANSPSESSAKVRRRVRLTTVGAERVVVMAPAIAHVVEALGVSAERLLYDTVVGVESLERPEPSRLVEIRKSLGIGRDDEVVTTIGRLDKRKSHELFVRAAAAISAHRQGVRFLIVGDGPLESDICDEITRLGLDGCVQMLGSRRDISDLLAITDVYVRPGVVEGFIGVTVLEAQAMGVPTVSFATEDVQLAIEDGVTGLLAKNADVGDLADKIESLLVDVDRAALIAEAGRERFVGTYALEGVVDRLEQLYSSLSDDLTMGSA